MSTYSYKPHNHEPIQSNEQVIKVVDKFNEKFGEV